MLFSRILLDGTQLIFATVAAVGTSTAVFVSWWWWTKKQKLQSPSKWQKVGELSDIMIFPIKSTGIVRRKEIECTKLGLRSGWLRDRTLMIIDLKSRLLMPRQFPKMVNVREAARFNLSF